jgi:transposase
MQSRLVNRPSAAAHCDAVRCVLAIELSGVSWVVAVLAPGSDKISLHKLASADVPALLELMARVRARVEGPVEIVSCYEAGYDGFWLHRRLTAAGVTNYVIDPASLQVTRRARRVKTDRIDAERLLRALMAHLRGEPKVVSLVHVPSPDQEDARRLHRERSRLVSERVQHVNRIKGLCAAQGICDYEPLKRDRWQRLDQLTTGDGRVLPSRLKAEIGRELKRLEMVLTMLAEVEAERDALLQDDAPAHPHADKVKALARLKSIGAEFATRLVGEVFFRSFDNRRQLAGYLGLCPSPFASGAASRDQGISKAGNATARTTLIEIAWLWLRHQPGSALSIWFRERVGTLKGRVRRIAIVALARKLSVALWRYLEVGLVPAGAELKA